MSPTVGFHALFRTPQTAGLIATYTSALAAKCHGPMLTCVLKAFMLPLPRAKLDWLQIALIGCKLLVCVSFLRQHGTAQANLFQAKQLEKFWEAADNAVYVEQLQTSMFLEAADGAEYVRQCGNDCIDIFSRCEQVQRGALDGFPDTKAVVWKCDGGCGGLVDGQRGILTSFMLALVSGRALLIQSDKPVPLHNYFHVANLYLRWTFEQSRVDGRTVLNEKFLNAVRERLF